MNSILVFGGAGFIGSAFLRRLPQEAPIVCGDALTYAGNLENINELIQAGKVVFEKGDIRDPAFVTGLLEKHQPWAVVNFAAESHVDNSIHGPQIFLETNIMGVGNLLQCCLKYWNAASVELRARFRFLQVSTDEVYGQLSAQDPRFTEKTPYAPNSPYSASKAAGDFLARAWNHTYGLPVVITNCSNNYGPRQFPEKLIPRMIQCCLREEKLPVYGRGENVRDWIHVDDHSEGVYLALTKGEPGQTYCFGGDAERDNLTVVKTICQMMDELKPRKKGSYADLIDFVEDRKGHDFRYAIDDSKATSLLGFKRKFTNFEAGLQNTIHWYLENGTHAN